MQTKNDKHCPKGAHQYGVCLSDAVHEVVKDTAILRNRSEREIRREWICFALRYLNRKTGHLPAGIENQPRPTFSDDGIFAADEDLFRKMDESPHLCWAGRLNNACIHANPLLVQFAGQPEAEFLRDSGRGWSDLVHPGDRTRVCLTSREGFRTLRTFLNSYRFRKADGSWWWIEDWAWPFYRPNGQPAGYVGFMRVLGYALELEPVPVSESIFNSLDSGKP